MSLSLRENAANFEVFCRRFEREDDCVRFLFDAKWPNGFRCPHCENSQYYLISTRKLPLYECRACRAQTSLIKGTIMEGSRTPLLLWLQAIYLHTQPIQINARQLSTTIGVTYKTAWLICHKIRHAMSRADSKQLLTGIVRITDAVYSRRFTSTFEWHKQEQPLLIGASDNEEGDIGYMKIKLQSKKPLPDKYDCPNTQPFIQQYVDPQAAANVTITRRYGKSMNKKLVLEGNHVTWWLGRLFRGVGPKHLQVYLDQYCYYHNRVAHSLFDNLLSDCSTTQTIIYPVLIGRMVTVRSFRHSRHSLRQSQSAS